MKALIQSLKDSGLKQEWVANQLGVTQATVSNWIKGKKKPRKHSLIALENLLDVELNELENE